MILSIKNRLRKISGLILLGIAAGLTACAPPQNPPAVNTNINVNANVSNANANTSPTNTEKQAINALPVTLPVLDAMFTDENFAGELKAKLELTDDQINQIKQISKNAVGNLSEEESGAYSGSTRAAIDRATNGIRDIIGDSKTQQLFELVRQRWEGGADMSLKNMPSAPGSVPTDTRIVINAPEYRMDVFESGKLVKSYKVGIGYPEFPLPNGMRKAETLIFNPTWTPPDEPWVKGSVAPGKTVDAGSKLNPLGPIKIPIGLPSLIHGGKNPSRLGTFASHGCVGLTDSQIKDFAFLLADISDTELTKEDVSDYEKNKTETKNVKLASPIPVELRYETIVVENGVLKIFRDVYERGTNTEENLRRLLDVYGVSFDNLNAADRDKILRGLEQMAYDAKGNPVEANTNTNSNGANKKDDDKSGSVTKNIKGNKEVTFQLAELQGKGYPAPVDMVMK